MKGLLACLIVATTSVAASAFAPGGASADKQIPQRDTRKPVPAANAAPAPEGTATLGGTVVADATGAPVRLAYVVLVGAGTGVLKVTSTDQTGKFSFTKLPADRYTVGASKLPYLGAVAGARRAARPGVPIVLANGATVADVAIRLPMAAAVSGIVYDERGQPAPGVLVSVQQRRMQNGERSLVASGGAMTDDRGVYRVHGLAPGEYVVTATPTRPASNARALTDAEVDAALRGSPIPPAPSGADTNTNFATVYYPGTTRVNDAQPILIATGEDRQNVDLRLERVRMGRIDGTVVTSDGQPLPAVTVFIMSTGGLNPLQNISTVRVGPPEGRFGISSAPGSFTLVARTLGAQAGPFAFAQVEVAGADVTGVQLVLQPPLTFPGRVSARGTTALPPLGGNRVQVQPLSRGVVGLAAPQVSTTSATGEFTVSNIVPGRYVIGNAPFFGASAASVTWGLESVVIDGKDVTDLPIDITTETLPKDVSLILGDRWQELSGRLTDASGAGVSDYTVLVFPVNEAYWLFGSRRIVTAQPGTDGRFTLGGPGPALLPAGDYYLAAVTDVSKDEQYDPAFLQSLLAASIRVTLRPGEKSTQDLRVR